MMNSNSTTTTTATTTTTTGNVHSRSNQQKFPIKPVNSLSSTTSASSTEPTKTTTETTSTRPILTVTTSATFSKQGFTRQLASSSNIAQMLRQQQGRIPTTPLVPSYSSMTEEELVQFTQTEMDKISNILDKVTHLNSYYKHHNLSSFSAPTPISTKDKPTNPVHSEKEDQELIQMKNLIEFLDNLASALSSANEQIQRYTQNMNSLPVKGKKSNLPTRIVLNRSLG